MSERQTFALGAVLSMTTGRLLCDLGDLYAIASFMVGRSVFTHELPGAFREAMPEILRQHPELSAVDTAHVRPDNWKAFLAEQVARFGAKRELTPLGWNRLADQSPLESLREMVGPDKEIIILEGQ